MISLSTALMAALDAETVRYAWLVELPGTLPIYWTTHDHPISYGGNIYASFGRVLTVPSFPRHREIRAHSITLTLSGMEQDLSDFLNGPNVIGGPCAIKLVLLSASGDVIEDTAIDMYAGTFDSWSYGDGGSASAAERIQIKINGPWVKPGKTAGRLTTDNSQQDFSSGDRFFEFTHENEENLPWGGKRSDA